MKSLWRKYAIKVYIKTLYIYNYSNNKTLVLIRSAQNTVSNTFHQDNAFNIIKKWLWKWHWTRTFAVMNSCFINSWLWIDFKDMMQSVDWLILNMIFSDLKMEKIIRIELKIFITKASYNSVIDIISFILCCHRNKHRPTKHVYQHWTYL